jgi:hypothetical protein
VKRASYELIAGAAATLLVLAVACSGGGDESDGNGGGRTPAGNGGSVPLAARPDGVPAPAEQMVGETTLSGEDGGERLLFSLMCVDGLLTLVTTRETVYAELPCDRFVGEDAVARFQGLSVDLTICAPVAACSRPRPNSTDGKLFVVSPAGASLEFTTGHLWREER